MIETVDIIGGFPVATPNCIGCGKPLLRENAWMTDGCPCNSSLGVNSVNETRWRLLMQLQQQQSNEIERLKRPSKANIQSACELATTGLQPTPSADNITFMVTLRADGTVDVHEWDLIKAWEKRTGRRIMFEKEPGRVMIAVR